jgi:hypothetical protein
MKEVLAIQQEQKYKRHRPAVVAISFFALVLLGSISAGLGENQR